MLKNNHTTASLYHEIEFLSERIRELEVQENVHFHIRMIWKMKESELNNTLRAKTGELAVLSEFLNSNVNAMQGYKGESKYLMRGSDNRNTEMHR